MLSGDAGGFGRENTTTLRWLFDSEIFRWTQHVGLKFTRENDVFLIVQCYCCARIRSFDCLLVWQSRRLKGRSFSMSHVCCGSKNAEGNDCVLITDCSHV